MNRIIILSFAIMALVGVMFAVILSVPEKQVQCKSGDGLCPAQCNSETDGDCLKSRPTTLGEVKRCLNDAGCVIVAPFCGNPSCTFSDVECNSGKFCATAIAKDYSVTWSAGRAQCRQPIEATCAPLENFQAKCVVGECRAVSKAN